MQNTFNERRFVIKIMFLVVGAIFILRLFFIQIIETKYKFSADNNVLRYTTEYPLRGLIYDRNGELLVINEASYDLMIIPRQVKAFDTLEFCTLLDIEREAFDKKFDAAKRYSTYKASVFEKQISKETYAVFQEKMFHFPGFYVQPRTLRKYPRPIAAQCLGYISEVTQAMIDEDSYYKSGDYIGVSGIEKSYEDILRGKKGLKIKLVDVHNREKGSYKDGIFDTVPVPGKNLYTTIDAELQAYGELLMTNKKGGIVAIEPETGEILALISAPNYDPNLLVGRVRSRNFSALYLDENIPLFNRALMGQYPPGSTFKMINALIGLNEGVITPQSRIGCSLGYHVGGLTVRCHPHPSPCDVVSSIQYSCNAFYCSVFRSIIDNKKKYRTVRAGFNMWRSYLESFGLGLRLETDLPNVGRGNIPTDAYYDRLHGRNRWNSVSIISLSIGQGELGITPLQMANVTSIMANRGYYIVPHIVKAVGHPSNQLKKFTVRNNTKIDSRHFTYVIEGMHQVVEAGTARNAKIDSIAVCGKTGTVQNPHGKNHSTFLAFAPMNSPKIAITVFVENAGYGSTYAAPIASLMIEKYLKREVQRKELETQIINTNLMQSR
ncbi:MAG: penicillin-binding protein 2 [Bacteroidales bacterium]|nr:penicillin-binding protein 2 [Bacteroidales bacterium]